MKLRQFNVVLPAGKERAEQTVTQWAVNEAHALSQVWDKYRAVIRSMTLPKFVVRARVEPVAPVVNPPSQPRQASASEVLELV